ncbi:AraC family transcriptional regulator [Aeromonas rivuli]|uniref:AraC family transcriptional regulator n=1 Tax=Aeromonas rivuli TaxID=648794 RepID=UPI001CC907A1|nr:AraC family transcriptional regulator [Aeromonas rivuli]UBO72392.1 helix-turn-helix domain-containing protein [Aeromonas rivuli]
MQFIKVTVLRDFKALCSHYKIDHYSMLDTVGIEPNLLKDTAEGVIPFIAYVRLLDLSAEVANAPLFGFWLAKATGVNFTGPLALGFRLQSSLSNALSFLKENINIYVSGAYISQESARDGYCAISIGCDYADSVQYPGICQAISTYLYNYIQLSSLGDSHLCRIVLEQPVPHNLKEKNIPIDFGGMFNGVCFPQAWLERGFEIEKHEVLDYINHKVEELRNDKVITIWEQTEEVIRNTLRFGSGSIYTVANSLNISVRTLQNRLKAEGKSYSELLKSVRYEMAVRALEGNESITQIAFHLGFSDVSVFSRCFKGWTGMSPNQWRGKMVKPLKRAG